MPPKMRFRFRKSVPVIPGLLNATVSRRGVSVNGRLGIFSRSWGTRGRSTTIDMPGTSGLFWRREDRRRKQRGKDAFETAFLERQASERRSLRAGNVLFVLMAAVLAGRLYLHPFSDCATTGHPGLMLLALIGTLYGGWRLARGSSPAMAGFGGLALVVPLALVAWFAYGALIASSVVCR